MVNKVVVALVILFYPCILFSQGNENAFNPHYVTQSFIENKGQIVDQDFKANPDVKYLLCSPGFNVQLRQTGFSYDTYTEQIDSTMPKLNLPFHKFKNKIPDNIIRHYYRIDIELLGCNANAEIVPSGESETYLNYFTAGTPKGGITNVHYYKTVLYKNIYPYIDLEFNIKNAEYNFIVHPGGKVSDIKLEYKGALSTGIVNGHIEARLAKGIVKENIPSSFIKSTAEKVDVRYISFGNNVYGFFTTNDMPVADLVIDPTPCLDWGTYYGSSGGENVQYGMALDKNNNIYISGGTGDASNIATAGASQNTYGGGGYFDAFIAKFNSSGTNLIWGTYYGGTASDVAYGIALDDSNNVYIAGSTCSDSNIATPGAYLTTKPGKYGTWSIFTAKFDPTGSKLLWGTYYGGGNFGCANNIAIGPDKQVYITGPTYDTIDIATPGAYQTTYGQAFVSKFNSANSQLIWGTYYDGGEGWAITFDKQNNIYFTGDASAYMHVTTPGAYQTTYGGGVGDACIAKLNSSGSKLLWSTLYGGPGSEAGVSIFRDANYNIYIAGGTGSTTGIATPGTWQSISIDGGAAYIAKFDSNCSNLLWGTYYGGKAGIDGSEVLSMAVDSNDDIYIAGSTDSSFTGIATSGAYQTTYGDGIFDGFVAKFNSSGTNLLWGTYLGNGLNGTTYGTSIVLDTTGNVYVAGMTIADSGIYTTGAYQNYTGANSAEFFLAKFGCNIPNGINEIEHAIGTINVYPNPSNGVFTFQANSGQLIADSKIEIYNVLGEEIYKNTFSALHSTLSVNISGQPSGIYLYRIISEKGEAIATGKLIFN
jgi:hypothetical protein